MNNEQDYVTIQGTNGVYRVPVSAINGKKLGPGLSPTFKDKPPVKDVGPYGTPREGAQSAAPDPSPAPEASPLFSGPAGMGDVQMTGKDLHVSEGGNRRNQTSSMDLWGRLKDDWETARNRPIQENARRDEAAEIMPLPGAGLLGKGISKLGAGMMEKATMRSGIPQRVVSDLSSLYGEHLAGEPIAQHIIPEVADKTLTAGKALKDIWPMAKTLGMHEAGLPWWMLWPMSHKALRGFGSPAQEYVAGKALSKAGPTLGAGIGAIPMMLGRPEEEE